MTNSKNLRVFASSYQMFLVEKFPVFLIMTGLYNHIHSLQNEENLTFLYRAPKYELAPLSVIAMSNNYKVENKMMKVKEIKEQTGMTNQSFPTYRRRLSGSGVIAVNDYGYCELALPGFKEITNR